jgi:hypothetical protein
MKKTMIDRFYIFLGKLSVDLIEIALIPLSDAQALKNAGIITYLGIYKSFLKLFWLVKTNELQRYKRDGYKLYSYKYFSVIFSKFNILSNKFMISLIWRGNRGVQIIAITGLLSWLWVAIQLESIIMILSAIIPIFFILTIPMGILFLFSGTPNWLLGIYN